MKIQIDLNIGKILNLNLKQILIRQILHYMPKHWQLFQIIREGIIVFGVKDKPREAIGMTNNNLENLDNKDFSNFLNESFAPEIFFNIEIFYVNGKAFGIIEVKESANKPLVCIKNNGKKQEILEGEIYYRYSGRSEKIRYSELKNIL
ncbi:ATP-binding protein, partial [Campylobacter coli]|nr:ATP-binding protein [Campylobacter coli]